MKDPNIIPKNAKRSGNPAKRATALAAGPQSPDPRQLFEAAFKDVVGSLLLTGWRMIDPKGVDQSEKLGEELGVTVPPKPEPDAGHLLIVKGSTIEDRAVPKLVTT